jgi:hypothetical protein
MATPVYYATHCICAKSISQVFKKHAPQCSHSNKMNTKYDSHITNISFARSENLSKTTVGFQSNRHPQWPWHAWRNFGFITLPGGPWQGQKFVRCDSFLSHTINIYIAKLVVAVSHQGKNLDTNGQQPKNTTYGKCHVWTFRLRDPL